MHNLHRRMYSCPWGSKSMEKKVISVKYFNHNYYCTTAQKEIQILDEHEELIKEKTLSNCYDCLTINNLTKDIYAITQKQMPIIDILDNQLNFKAMIKIDSSFLRYGKIKNFTFCKNLNGFLVTTAGYVVLVSLTGQIMKIICKIKRPLVKNGCCTEKLGCCFEKYEFIDAICCNNEVYVAYIYNGEYYIADIKAQMINKVVFQTVQVFSEIFIKDGYIWLLSLTGDKKELICTGIECYSCNAPNISIINSIAAIESCLAQILCAEAEKIKAAIKNTQNNKELLCINESVNKIIYKITMLEFILTEKLQMVLHQKNNDECCE